MILLIDVSADLLTTGTGPILLVSSVSAPASLRTRFRCRQIFRHVQRPCSPLHRLTGDRRSLRLPSTDTSSPVGTAHPHRCLACSSQAAAGSPPSRKSRNMCGAAPLSFNAAVCWLLPAGVPFPLSEGVLAHRCSGQPCRGRRFLGLCRPWRGGTIPLLAHSPRTAPAAPRPGPPPPARLAASLWGWSPRTPSSARTHVRRRTRPGTYACPSGHHRPADASPPGVPRVLDSILSGASHPAHLGWHARDVELVADPSEGSHHPVQLFLVLRAVSPRPSVLTQGLERLTCQVGDLRGMVDCSFFPNSSSSSCSTCSAAGNNEAMSSNSCSMPSTAAGSHPLASASLLAVSCALAIPECRALR
jgi:hypothetical protein